MPKSRKASPPSPKTTARKPRESEYRRARNINAAFVTLQERIPYLRPSERKQLPKIKTLRLAMQYIHHLTRLIDGNEMADPVSNEIRPLTHPDFRQVVTDEMRTRNSYRERAHSEEMDADTVQRILAREESRRRMISVPVEVQMGILPRQFGSTSNNVHNNTRPVSFHDYNAPQMQMMAPHPFYGAQPLHHQNQNQWPTMGIENQYMMHNNNSHSSYRQ